MGKKQSTIRVLLLSVRSDIGGGPRHIEEILDNQSSSIHYYIAAPDNSHYSQSFKSNSVEFLPIPHRRFSLVSLLKIIQFCRDHGIQIIHSHGFGAGIYTKTLSLFGFRVIHTFHGLHAKNSYLGKFKILLERAFSKSYAASISVSWSEQKNLMEQGIPSIVIPNGVSKSIIKKVNPTQKPLKTIGVISRFDPQKNLEWFIESIPKILPKYPHVNFSFAGDGEQKKLLINLVRKLDLKEKVQFIGFQDPLTFFSSIDLLIFPSLGEGLPYTVLEAMAQGVPLIASRVQGHTDIIPDEYLFSLDDPSEMIIKISNPCKNFQSFIEENFLIQDRVLELELLFTSLA